MPNEYLDVTTRFLNPHERLIHSKELEMPLVIEANTRKDLGFLQEFLASHSVKILEDVANYGAVLLRGFDVQSDDDFEKSVLSIQGFRGISEAFMSEQGRIHPGHSKYVLHTNAVYKTGGTLYLGGFHSENYYSADVPSYISFCCLKPSLLGGETGLINMEKIYQGLADDLKQRLEKNTFFVSKWLVSEVAERYQITEELIERICKQFDLPIVGQGKDKFILMYKPSIFEHPLTKEKALQINLFELATLNAELRKCFINDYKGRTWFWHRLVWNLPPFILKAIEFIYVTLASLFYSPRESFKILRSKYHVYKSAKKENSLHFLNQAKVGSCFKENDIKALAVQLRTYYSSCLWKKGDILLVDNRKVMHAGMPGSGPRLVRALIGNPIDMKYCFMEPGLLHCKDRWSETIGFYMSRGKFNVQHKTNPVETTENQTL